MNNLKPMKTNIQVFLILFFSTLLSHAQTNNVGDYSIQRNQDLGTPNTFKILGGDTINKSDDTGKLQGQWKHTHEDGTLKCQGSYKDGYKMGYWERKWPNGNYMYQINMHEGYRNGYSKSFYENGTIEKEGNYIMEKEEGLIKTYYENGMQKSEENFKEGILNGLCKYFDELGFMTMKGEFLNNERNGEWYFYSQKTSKLNAQVTIVTYDNGKTINTIISPL